MTRDEFSELSLNEKIGIVIESGTEVLNRVYLLNIVRLYSVGDFYAEIWYKTTTNKIERCEVVEMDEVFHLYEKSIDIKDLFKN
ncbi:MAG: hypothetical protein Q8908_05285 [Bacteroidota bacterium]|nr:hypothetical protein [Bacteroidota bacterium]